MRLKLLLILPIILLTGVGVVIGRLSAMPMRDSATIAPSPTSKPSTQPAPWFDEQLNLTADQRKQMDAIWDVVHQAEAKSFDTRQSLDRDREAAIRNLLTDEQKTQYDAIVDQSRSKRADLDAARGKVFADANERSRAILDDTQKAKWDELSQQHRWHGRHRPATQPGGTTGWPSTNPDRMSPPPPGNGPGPGDRP